MDFYKDIQQRYEDVALQDAQWCHDSLPRFTGKWRRHYETVMYYCLFKWAGYRE